VFEETDTAPVAEKKVVAENVKDVYESDIPVEMDSSPVVSNTDELSSLIGNWNDIIDRISRVIPLMRPSLLDTVPLSVTDELVLIGCDPGFSGDLANFRHHKNHSIVARFIGDALKRKIAVEFMESEVRDLLAAQKSVQKEGISDDTVPDINPEPNKVKNNSKELHDWGKLPVVQEAMDMFNGFLMEVRA
jgi:hypothetical protein